MYKQGEEEKKNTMRLIRGTVMHRERWQRAYFEHDFLPKIEVKYKTYARCSQ